MKKTILAALLVTASIGSQVFDASAATATRKVGQLTFALTDTQQVNIKTNGVSIPFDYSSLVLVRCQNKVQYFTSVVQVNTARVIKAITATTGIGFPSNAKLVILNYDNAINAPPYPPYLLLPNVDDPFEIGQQSYNGAQDPGTLELIIDPANVGDFGYWPLNVQSDWVDFDIDNEHGAYVQYDGEDTLSPWPKARVFVVSNSGGTTNCLEVSDFFSFEEAYCHFCWDTQERVTSGTITLNGRTSNGTPCILPTTVSCQATGSGNTKFYLTVKFNNSPADNIFLPYDPLSSNGDRLIFTVGGVVNYPWNIKPINGVATAMGTMTMNQANGNGINPYCGVFTGSVRITETTDAQIPSPCYP